LENFELAGRQGQSSLLVPVVEVDFGCGVAAKKTTENAKK
jgi:hypothetical protein